MTVYRKMNFKGLYAIATKTFDDDSQIIVRHFLVSETCGLIIFELLVKKPNGEVIMTVTFEDGKWVKFTLDELTFPNSVDPVYYWVETAIAKRSRKLNPEGGWIIDFDRWREEGEYTSAFRY